MLVLTRSVGEAIQVGPDVYVTVVKISPNSVRIGIEAPQDTSIARGELLAEGHDNLLVRRPEPLDFQDA